MASAYQSYQLLSSSLHEFPFVDGRTRIAGEFLDKHCNWPSMRYVLEVGSNRGDFLAYLQSVYPHLQLLGVETSPLSLVGVPTIFNDIRDIRFSPSFDLVVIRQVLEHIPDPIGFMQHLASCLREGGLLLVEVPDLENDLKEGIDPWVMEHVGVYSKRSLDRLGGLADLSLLEIDRRDQLLAIFKKDSRRKIPEALESHSRWEKIEQFKQHVEACQNQWLAWVRQGYELCFYGASNEFLAISGLLRQEWGKSWDDCKKSLIDDYPAKHSTWIGGIQVKSLEEYVPKHKCIYIVCAMNCIHREKMIPRLVTRKSPEDKLFAMWNLLDSSGEA